MIRLLLGLALTLAFATPVTAAPRLICSISPSAAPVDSTFTLDITGAHGVDEIDIDWYLAGPGTPIGQNTDSIHFYYDISVAKNGRAATSQIFDVPGSGYVVATIPYGPQCAAPFVVT